MKRANPSRVDKSQSHGCQPVTGTIEPLEAWTLLSAGDPDGSFGNAGVAAFDVRGAYADVPAVDVRYGKTLVASAWFDTERSGIVLTLLDAAGHRDSAFGVGGQVDLPAADVRAAGLTGTGKSVLLRDAGWAGAPEPQLARLTKSGSADASFGTPTGTVALDPTVDYRRLLVDTSGRMVVAGIEGSAGGDRLIVERFGSDGKPDTMFGTAGRVTVEVPGLARPDGTEPLSLAARPDGSIVVAATSRDSAGSSTAVVVAIGSKGGVVPAFGSGGTAAIDLGLDTAATGVAVDVGGGVLLAVARGNLLQPLGLRADGSLARTFDAIACDASPAVALSVATDGKVVAVGDGFQNALVPHYGFVARYNANGTLDRTFAPGLGYLPVDAFATGGVQPDGRVVLAGAALQGGVVRVARYLAGGTANPSGIALSADGTLRVTGTAAAEAIQVSKMPGDYSAFGTGRAVLQVQCGAFFRGFDPARVKKIVVNAGAGDDTVDLSGAAATGAVPSVGAGDGDDYVLTYGVAGTLKGGAGNDQLTGSGLLDGGPWADDLRGGPGNDTLRGGPGDDNVMGFGGDDLLDGGTGANTIFGDNGTADLPGQGVDTVDYSSRTVGVNVSLDDVADDGQPGERDNVHGDVENIVGGAGADVLRGSDKANVLRGNGGNDKLYGGGGNDRLDGGAGADDLWGGAGTDALDYGTRARGVYIGLGSFADDGEPGEHDNAHADLEIVIGGMGNDTIVGTAANEIFFGNAGDDVLRGGGGDDVLTGGPGKDKLYGEAGNYKLFAKDGFIDLADGGPGHDSAVGDPKDLLVGIEG